MKTLQNLSLIVLCFFFSQIATGQNVLSALFPTEIPTSALTYDPICNGPITTLTVSLPAGELYSVDSVRILYQMTAQGTGFMSDQRSKIFFENTGTEESEVSGVGTTIGTYSYSRLYPIATGLYPGDSSLTFQLHARRTFTGTAGCNSLVNSVDASSWRVFVYYSDEINTPKASVNQPDPKATLDINGKIRIADDINLPVAGVIRFNSSSQNFEGFDGSSWIRLSNPEKEILGLSNTTSTASFIYGGLTGIQAANKMCIDSYPDEPTAHFYLPYEIDEAVALGNVPASVLNINTWAYYHNYSAFDTNDTEANNCSCFLNNSGDITVGTRLQIRFDTPQSGMPTGYIINYQNSISCSSIYRIVCGK